MKTNPSATDVTRFETAEAAVEYLKRTTFSGPSFTLNIADSFTFAGQPDTMGMGMATVVDTILAKGFWPDGFEQKVGYRVYRYKTTK